jgi:hypothetical protein
MRRIFHQRPYIYMPRWLDCAIASVAFLAVAATLHFFATASKASLAERAFGSLVFSATMFAAGLVFGLLVWGGSRLFAGRETDIKDTALWTASILGVICVGVAVLSKT